MKTHINLRIAFQGRVPPVFAPLSSLLLRRWSACGVVLLVGAALACLSFESQRVTLPAHAHIFFNATPSFNFTPALLSRTKAAWDAYLTPTTDFSTLPPLEVEAGTGLTGRLRVLVSYLAVARAERRRLVVHWVPGEDCPSSFDELFEPIGSDVSVIDSRGPGWPEFEAHEAYATDALSDERGSLLAAMVLRIVRPRPALALRIDALLGQLGGAGTFSAVHIRRTDMAHVMGVSLGHGGYSTFIDWSRAGFGDGGAGDRTAPPRVFVAADHPQSLGAMRDGLSADRIVAQDVFAPLPASLFSFSMTPLRLTGVDAAVVDMWTASYAARFLGSPQSSFSALIEAMRRARGLRPSRSFSCVWCRVVSES